LTVCIFLQVQGTETPAGSYTEGDANATL